MRAAVAIAVLLLVASAHANSVADRAYNFAKAKTVFPQGCSGLVSQALGRAWEDANSLMGSSPKYLGTNGQYGNPGAGAIIGWKNGHVAVWVGRADCVIADSPGPGKPARCLSNYGPQAVYRSSRF